jgi:TrmH family RNA methyltransferase
MLPIQKGSWKELQDMVTTHSFTPVIAGMIGESPAHFCHEKKLLLILGNESQGTRPPKDFLYKKVTIPMPGPMESLNVAIAGAILMYSMGVS